MINKEDLETIVDTVTWSYEECGGEVPQNILDTLNEIKQMFRNQPSLSECIKEWEDRGFEIIERENYIIFRHHKTYKSIAIYLIDLSYISYEWYDAKRPIANRLNVDEAQSITLELHNLIHKTLKALEVEKG